MVFFVIPIFITIYFRYHFFPKFTWNSYMMIAVLRLELYESNIIKLNVTDREKKLSN